MSNIDAKEANKFISKLSDSILRSVAITTLKEETPIHTIGCINIYTTSMRLFSSVNKESLKIKYFDTETEAIDYYLDQYKGTIEAKQQNLFEE